MTFYFVLASSNDDRETYNCLCSCYANTIRNADCFETLNVGKEKCFKIVNMINYLSYELKDLNIWLLCVCVCVCVCVKWNK